MRALFVAAALVAVAACGGTAGRAVTPTDFASCVTMGPSVRPSSATLHPGDTLRASASLPLCSSLYTTFRWSSSDSSIALVDSVSGLIRARALGTVSIIAAASLDRTVKGAMLLVVAQ